MSGSIGQGSSGPMGATPAPQAPNFSDGFGNGGNAGSNAAQMNFFGNGQSMTPPSPPQAGPTSPPQMGAGQQFANAGFAPGSPQVMALTGQGQGQAPAGAPGLPSSNPMAPQMNALLNQQMTAKQPAQQPMFQDTSGIASSPQAMHAQQQWLQQNPNFYSGYVPGQPPPQAPNFDQMYPNPATGAGLPGNQPIPQQGGLGSLMSGKSGGLNPIAAGQLQ